jgi:hypothetical protein
MPRVLVLCVFEHGRWVLVSGLRRRVRGGATVNGGFGFAADVFDAEQEAYEDEMGAYGDPRRCPIHGEQTSSPDGMFDAPCGACEGAMDDVAQAWECDPANDTRRYCGPVTMLRATPWRGSARCEEDSIPF